MTSSTILTVTCLAVTACVAIFMIISISLPQWYTATFFVYGAIWKTKLGLFNRCVRAVGHRECLTFKEEVLEGV